MSRLHILENEMAGFTKGRNWLVGWSVFGKLRSRSEIRIRYDQGRRNYFKVRDVFFKVGGAQTNVQDLAQCEWARMLPKNMKSPRI